MKNSTLDQICEVLSQSTVSYARLDKDLHCIQDAIEAHFGTTLKKKEVELLWDAVSESQHAGWLECDDDDFIIYSIERYLDERKNGQDDT